MLSRKRGQIVSGNLIKWLIGIGILVIIVLIILGASGVIPNLFEKLFSWRFR